jgi:hypothetical protein
MAAISKNFTCTSEQLFAAALIAVVHLLFSGAALAQPFRDNADGVPGGEPTLDPAPGAGAAYLPRFDIKLQFLPSNIGLREDQGVNGLAEFEYASLERLGQLGGLGLRFPGNSAINADGLADDEMPAGQFTQNARFMRFGTAANRNYLDRTPYRAMGGVAGEWRYRWNSHGQFSLFAQQSRIRYLQDAMRSYDGNQFLAGAGWLQTIDADERGYLFAGIFGGQDRATDNRPDGDRTIGGLRVSVHWGTSRRTDMFAYASAASGRFDRPASSYFAQRRDLQYDAGIGLNWRFAASWSVRPQLTFTRNDSNFELYDSNRYDLSVTLRRDFR